MTAIPLQSRRSKIENRKSCLSRFPYFLLVAGGLIFSRGVSAQQASNVFLDSNEILFSVLAALNASGYDTGLGAGVGNTTREEVRAVLAQKRAPAAAEIRKFYEAHRVAADPGADLGQYVSLALLLGPPPDFRFSVRESDLPPDAKSVAGLVPLLKSFHQQADLTLLWARLEPRYQEEISRYTEAVRRSIVVSDAYLRFPSGAYLGRTYSIFLCLLGTPEQVHARIYGQNYFLVVTPSKELKLNEIRHQYLHFLLDPLALKYSAEIHQKSALSHIARLAPALASDFKEDYPLLVTECLIRAVEIRMDKRPKSAAQKSVDELTASGLLLVPYFYQALAEYEQQESSMNVFYKTMVLGIDMEKEEKRLASVKFSPRPAVAPQSGAPVVSEEERLLNQADNYIYEKRYSDARTVYQTVLEKINPKSERALFGLAVAASNTRKPDLAEEYFLKTLEAARDLRIVTWSHIYLGRLLDLKGKRPEALEQYRAASLTAGTFPDALRAVQNGLARAFGSQQ